MNELGEHWAALLAVITLHLCFVAYEAILVGG
jgi:hypothetical protein